MVLVISWGVPVISHLPCNTTGICGVSCGLLSSPVMSLSSPIRPMIPQVFVIPSLSLRLGMTLCGP